MIKSIKYINSYLIKKRQRLLFLITINWSKTIYFNFKKFPFSTAKKLPVYFYGKVNLKSIKGNIIIDAPIRRGMIGFGQSYEIITSSNGTAELFLEGEIVFKGNVQFGKDYFVYIAENGFCEMGNMSSLGSRGKLICFDKIVLGQFARIGFESQIIDTTAHQMINTITRERLPSTSPIKIGDFNYISNRVTILSRTITANYCNVTSNSLCNKDYSSHGENILIGGIPAKLLKNNISRDWDSENENMRKWLIV